MPRQRTPEVDFFVHYSLQRPETYAHIGRFVCGTPLHLTFTKITTREPDAVLETLRGIMSQQSELPHMQCDELKVAYGKCNMKPIMTLHDTAQRLAELQTLTSESVTSIPSTRVYSTSFGTGRVPHVTIDQLSAHAQVPASFDIDHLLVTSGTKIEPWHWHNYVWDILRLGEESVSSDLAECA